MNRKQERQAKRAAREAAAAPKPETFETEAEANSALSQQAKVINMAEKKKEAEKKAAKKPSTSTIPRKDLPKLPSMPKSAAKPKPLVDCRCGCGGQTRTTFMPGHDSHHRAVVLRVERGLMDKAGVIELLGEAAWAAVEQTIKEKKAAAKADAKAANAKGE